MISPTSTLLLGNVLDWRNGLAGLCGSRPNLPAAAVRRSETAREEPTADAAELDDAAWAARVRDGDEDAARALVQRLYPTIIKSIRCHLPRRTSEEDLAQAVFAKIFKSFDQFSGLVPLEHWVSRIAINTCINQLKREAVRPEFPMGDLSEEEQGVVQHLASTDGELPGDRSNAARELLEKLLVRLRPDERLVITLLHLEERSSEQISQLTGWSVSLVKVKAFRARRKMRKLWNTLFNGERP